MSKFPINQRELMTDIRELVERSADLYAEKDAFLELNHSSEPVSVSYKTLLSDIRIVGTALLSKGYAQKRIALIGENSYAWVLGYLSIINSGMTVVPIDKELSSSEITDQVERAHVDAICCTDLYKPETEEVIERLYASNNRLIEMIELGTLASGSLAKKLFELGEEEVSRGNCLFDQVELDRSATCCIMFTSGTTGKSKGVQLSHTNLAVNIKGSMEMVTYTTEDVFVSVLPIHHSFESMAGILCPVYHGSTIGFCPSIKAMSKCFEVFQPTALCLVPLHVETFQNKILRSVKDKYGEKTHDRILEPDAYETQSNNELTDILRPFADAAFGGRLSLIVAGGAPVAPSQTSFYKLLDIDLVQGYGVTECSPVVASNQNGHPIDNSVGIVASCGEVKIGEEGQIMVKGASVMKGYLDDEENSFIDGWFPTGDLGYFKDGNLYITGRCSDVIVMSSGKNIMPQEIEQRLTSFSSIAEAVVIDGLSKGNGVEFLVAHICPDYDFFDSTPSNKDDTSYIQARVLADVRSLNQDTPPFKRIFGVVIHEKPLEKTTTRKIKRFLLKGKTEGMIHV